MTLTTETLNLWRNNAEITAGETAEDDPEHIAAKAILALTAELLANREAQPVGFRYRHMDTSSWLYNDWRWPDSVEANQCQIEWLYTAPPAPASEPIFFIEIEGDDWINAGRIPGSTFDFNNLPDGVNKLYAAPPAPAVPGIDELRLTFERSERESDDGFNLHKYGIGYADESTQARWESWLACRSAMLDQPVNSGYKLVPVDFLTTASRLIDLCRTYSILSDGGNYKERTISECESTMEVIDGLLTAAPEGGNG